MSYIRFVSLVSLVTLTACGGGGGGERQTYDELALEFQQIDAQFDRGNLDEITDPMTLPTTGAATYSGVLGAELPEASGGTISLIGDMSLTANFQNDQVSGNVTNFVDSNTQNYSGSLQISDGEIDRTVDVADTYTFATFLDGQLRDESNEIFTVDASLRGDFYGPNEAFIGGDLSGEIVTPTGTVTLDGSNSYLVGER